MKALPALLVAPMLFAQPAAPSPEGRAKAAHLLSRLSFGPRPGEVDALARSGGSGIQAWLDAQLHPKPEPALETWIRTTFPTQGMSIAEIQAAFPRPAAVAKAQGLKPGSVDFKEQAKDLVPPEKRPARIADEQAGQKLARAIESRNQLQEVLTDFWFNHFNVDESKGLDRWLLPSYERDAIRPHVFGRFRDLLGAVAWHPAMLFYLDNWLSVKDGLQLPRQPDKKVGLNENYGRELMELHTLGVDGGYTQADVREAARCFTGWSIQEPQKDAQAVFRPRAHDEDPKTVLGTAIRAGGRGDGEQVLDMLAASPVTARHLSFLLCRRFISDAPPPSAVDRLTKVYLRTGGDLRAVYEALFTSPEFWSKEAVNAKVKTPFEFVVSSVRALDGHVDDPLPIAGTVARMGEPLYRCQPPTGYKDTAEAWVSTGALVERLRFGAALAKRQVPGVVWPDLPPMKASDPEAAVDAMAPRFVPGGLSQGTRAELLKALDAMPRTYADGETRPVDPTQLLGFLLGSPEFQRR